VVLAGPAGVGKTRLGDECLALAADHGFAAVKLAGTQAVCSLPFGAYASLLPEQVPTVERTEVLSQAARAVASQGEGKRVALLVDDAHLLDDASAALTHQLAASKQVFVIVTVRSGEPASDAVVALWKDGLADRVELCPPSRAEVDELLTAVLGGSIDGAAVRLLFERTGGNLLFLKELVVSAIEAGVLSERGGLWRLHGGLPTSARLVELVEARLAGLVGTDRQALEVLAVAEPLGVDLLPHRHRSLAALERRGLVRIEEDGRRLQVRLTHPLYGDVLRARLSPLRSRALSRSLAQAVESTGARRRDDVLRVATWRLDGGGGQAASMLSAAQQARALHDFSLAERLARAALAAGGGFPAAILAAQLASLSGRSEEAEAELAVLAATAGDDAARGLVAVTRVDNLRFRGSFAEALRVAGEAESGISDPAWRDELAAKRAGILLDVEGPAAAASAAEALCRSAGGRALVWACLISAFAQGRAGRLDGALDAASRGHEASSRLSGRPLQWPPGVFQLARSEALRHGGQLEEAEALAAGEYGQALASGSDDGQAYAAWQLAKVLLSQGRAEGAVRYGLEAAALLRQLGRPLLLRECLVPLAAAEALRGQATRAAIIVAELDALQLPWSGWTGVDLLQERAWTAVAAGDVDTGRAVLNEAVARSAEVGDRVGEASALHDLARLGQAAEVAPRLAELAGVVEGSLMRARAAHAAALVAKDPVALEAASIEFAGMKALLLAAEAAADAAVAWRKAGDPRKAAAAERRAHALAARCEGARTPALTAVSARAALTARELEIARLAAAGVANKEIAARLYLSLHTVQNKLHAAYEKLGVEGRAELAQALEGY
jgi:DNA-binding CsgD family transcriptional regulator